MASLPLPALQQARSTPAPASDIVGTAATAPARLSALEWSIVAMAEKDGIGSLREPSRYSKAVRSLFGIKQPNRLANEKLETLRRIAVYAWRHGWNVPNSELTAFLAAGFTSDHFELIQTSVGRARTALRRKRAR